MSRAASLIIAIAVATGPSCGGSSPPSTPGPTIQQILIVAGSQFGVGLLTQLSASARMSDGTLQNVSAQATWQSSNTAVATVTSSGLMVGLAAGVTEITATVQGIVGHLNLVFVAPRVLTLTGVVTDGFSGGVLPNINIRVTDYLTNSFSATTTATGSYTVGPLPAGQTSVTASGVGYLSATRNVNMTGDTRVDIVLPRVPAGLNTLTCNGAPVPDAIDCPDGRGRQAPTSICNDGTFSCSTTLSGNCGAHQGVSCVVCPGPLCQ